MSIAKIVKKFPTDRTDPTDQTDRTAPPPHGGGGRALHGRRLAYGEWRQTEEQRWADLARCGKPRNWKAAMDRLAMCRYHSVRE